jgi:hypothetical protein
MDISERTVQKAEIARRTDFLLFSEKNRINSVGYPWRRYKFKFSDNENKR